MLKSATGGSTGWPFVSMLFATEAIVIAASFASARRSSANQSGVKPNSAAFFCAVGIMLWL